MEEADVVRIVESSIAKKNENLLASLKSMLESSLTDLKRSHADTADSHLKAIKKLKFDEPHRFKKKGNEDQYRFNLKVGDAIEEAKEVYTSQQLDKVHASLEKGEKLLSEIVHGPGPQKMTFRYHSGGVMLTRIFENFNYSSFILCMIAILNEQLNSIYHVTK